MTKLRISAAGNTEVPAYLALIAKGYSVHWGRKSKEIELWYAKREDHEFVAEGPIELLGLVSMYEVRGENWKATDKEIDSFMKKYEI